jgi:hypothetical protein
MQGKRIGLVGLKITGRRDMIFILDAGIKPWDKSFPYARFIKPWIQGMQLLLPTIEIAHYRNLIGIGSPNGKVESICIEQTQKMAPEFLISIVEHPLLEQPDILVCKERIIPYMLPCINKIIVFVRHLSSFMQAGKKAI